MHGTEDILLKSCTTAGVLNYDEKSPHSGVAWEFLTFSKIPGMPRILPLTEWTAAVAEGSSNTFRGYTRSTRGRRHNWNHQMKRITPELASHPLNFLTTPKGMQCALNSHRAARTLVWWVEAEERWEVPDHPQGTLLQNWGGAEPNRTVTCMVLKATANDRRTI
ncbi:hypothetical protein TNCV_4231071 [Trichonephila clavipes]|uniref:Uncharacterized protein n=1 Tax=Trichonephila clavipes TaxID=2585209 RepID=A0A8X6SHN8_TRICX|nr:hypothetical protein TNCV_4231071 [Trichonephila clavipes]